MNIYSLISVVLLSLFINNNTYTSAQISKKLYKTQSTPCKPKVIENTESLLSDDFIPLIYSPNTGNTYNYKVESSVSQTLGDMFDFKARTSAYTSMQLSIDRNIKKQLILTYQYGKGNVSFDGLSMAGIPDTTFTTDSSLLPETQELINPQGIVLKRIHTQPSGTHIPARSEQLLQSLAQGARYFLIEFPLKPIKKDSSWKITKIDTIHTSALEGNSSIIMNTNLNYIISDITVKNGTRIATIQCSSHSLGFKGTAEQSGVFLTIDGEGTAKGMYNVELLTGIPIDAQLSMEYELRMAATGQENAIFPVTMNMDIKYMRTGFSGNNQQLHSNPKEKQSKKIK
jgi:hypothetical protein